MKVKIISLVFLFLTIVQNLFGQTEKKDSIKYDFQMIINAGKYISANNYFNRGMSFGVSDLWVKIRPSGLTTKIGFDVSTQAFDNGQLLNFNRDSLWFTNYVQSHKTGSFVNGLVNVQVGLPMSIGYTSYTRDNKDRVEFNLGVTSYYTLSYFTETYDDEEKGSKFTQSINTNLYFIQNPINFMGTTSFNYIVNKNWIFGLNATYALNSLYKTRYMNFHPFTVGVSLGVNINNENKNKKSK